ncbi:hypothetical protein TWF718_010513 [Orbilia javanica]|uniref:Rhodopsin domain-containing protein n=1 Tax=Orbilia javanica TaxID=47235 RepID=A0AAN8MUI9_9PEZI
MSTLAAQINSQDIGCTNRVVFYLSTSVLHIVADVIIAILPIPLVLKIKGPLIYRISLLGALMLGLLATIACAGRLVILVEAYRSKGYFYQYATMINTWSYTECALGIIGASIPALKPVLRKIFQVLGAAGWTNASCTGPQDRSGQSGSLPYHVAIEENKRRINDLDLVETGATKDSQCSMSDSKPRTDSSGSSSARTQATLTTRPEVSVPLAAKLRMSGCNSTC